MNFNVKARFKVLFASVFEMSLADGSIKRSWVKFCFDRCEKRRKKIHSGATSLGWNDFTVAPNKHSQLWIIFSSTGVLFQINLLTVRREDYPEENMYRFLLKKKNTLNFSWHIEQLSHNMGTMMMGRVSFRQAVRFKVTWEVRSDSVLRTIFFIYLWNFYSLTT